MTSPRRIVAAVLAGFLILATDAVAELTVPRFSPAERSKTLEVGKTTRLDYKLELPARMSRPLDVYLLVDASPSMESKLPALRAGLMDGVYRVSRRGGDVLFGVGELRTTGAHDWTDGLTYRRLQGISVSGAAYGPVDRIGRDRTRLPGVTPGDRAHTVALDQAVRGTGHWPYVTPGQQAGFRSSARKVVVLVTDDQFAGLGTQPSREQAIATLAAAGVQVVGLALDARALKDLEAVARGTGSYTAADVDCGAQWIARGQAAACVARPDAVGRVMEKLFDSHSGEVAFTTTGTGVRKVDPTSRWVDLTRKNSISTKLEVACASGDAGRTHYVTLSAWVTGQLVATARATVRCKGRN